jgi:hypothetical protein
MGQAVSLWDLVVSVYGEQTTIALAALEAASLLLIAAATTAFAIDLRRRREQAIVDERERMVQAARRSRGLA